MRLSSFFNHFFLIGLSFGTALAVRAETPAPTVPASASNLAFVTHKILTGQPVRIGFIGGSITQGSGVKSHGDCYYWLTKLRLTAFAKETNSPVETLLAAVGGTGSDYGVYRIGRQLLDKDIDLLVIEFAVNDGGNPAALDGMEGLVRQTLERNPRTGIVIFDTTSKTMVADSYDQGKVPPSVEAFHRVALHYGLTEINAGPAVQAVLRDGKSRPELFFPDTVHPSKEGHAFYAGFLSDALIAALKAASSAPVTLTPLPPPLGSGRLSRARWQPIIAAEKTGDWTELKPNYYTSVGSWKTSAANSSISFDAAGERIVLLCVTGTRLHVTGPGIDKTITVRARPGGIPTQQLIYDDAKPFSGRLTVTVLADDKGRADAELAGLAVISTSTP